MESRRVREVAVRSQEEVAQVLGVSQRTVARLERRAFRKLRAHPEARILLRYISQQNAQRFAPTIEPDVLRLGSTPADTSFLTISGFAPNL
jgi:DNA-binding XRE family transcriptional regulator